MSTNVCFTYVFMPKSVVIEHSTAYKLLKTLVSIVCKRSEVNQSTQVTKTREDKENERLDRISSCIIA